MASILIVAASCGGSASPKSEVRPSSVTSASHPTPSNAVIPCVADQNVGVAQEPVEPPVHIPLGVRGHWQHDPPSSGEHWAAVPPWGVLADHPIAESDALVPEWYVSSLEHGGVAVLYRNASSRDDVVTFIRHAPIEASVGAPKLGDVPYPTLSHPFALVAWGWLVYLEQLDDPLALRFYFAHVDHGPQGGCP